MCSPVSSPFFHVGFRQQVVCTVRSLFLLKTEFKSDKSQFHDSAGDLVIVEVIGPYRYVRQLRYL